MIYYYYYYYYYYYQYVSFVFQMLENGKSNLCNREILKERGS